MTRNTLTQLIEKYHAHVEDDVRDYIGASIIGADCWRQIWYEYNGEKGEDIPNKTRRTWAIGKHLEGLILDWLSICGLDIARVWFDLQSDNVPVFKGHVDSVWTKDEDTLAIIEIKTAKDASFKIFVRDGVKLWNPRYYAQLQAYMGMSRIFSAYILVLNKDNSELSDELVIFDKEFYASLENKAQMIASADMPPPRINSSPLWYECKLCKYNKVCHS